MTKSLPAIILNSGSSKRLGRPKSLVRVNDKTLISYAVEKLQLAGCNPVVVVVNKELQFDTLLNSNGAVVVVNSSPERGRTGSLKVALKSIMADIGRVPNGLIMSPVDRPGWKSFHIRHLIEASNSACLYQDGVKGHPVKIVKNDLLKILSSADDIPLRDVVEFENTEVSDALLKLNIDTHEDLLELAKYSEYFDEL